MYSSKDFFNDRDQIRRFLQSWSHLLKKSVMENLIFYADATDHLEMSYLGLCRHFEIILDIVEIINSTHYYIYAETRSFRDEMLHLQE